MTSILEKALEATRNSRSPQYAHPILNFARTALFWQNYLTMVGVILPGGKPMTPEHVAQMMVQFKIARDINLPLEDNLVDEAGYTDCVDRIDKALRKMGINGLQGLREMSFHNLTSFYNDLLQLPPGFFEGI